MAAEKAASAMELVARASKLETRSVEKSQRLREVAEEAWVRSEASGSRDIVMRDPIPDFPPGLRDVNK